MPEHFTKKFSLAVTHLDTRTFLHTLRETCCSFNHYYLIRLNLSKLEKRAPSRIAYSVEKMRDQNIDLIRKRIDLFDGDSRRELLSRLFFYEQGLVNCYTLKTGTNDLACIQWIVYPNENALLHHAYPRQYLSLATGEVMLEKVFVFPRYRGLGLVQSISYELLQKAKGEGFRTAIGYVRKDAIASLNEFIRLGFTIRKLVEEYKLFGYTKRIF